MNTNKPNIIIIGASGHAKVIIDIIEKLNQYTIIGLIDSFKRIGSKVYNYEIIGREENIPSLKTTYHFNEGIIAIGDNWTRKVMHKKIIEIDSNFKFISAVHPNAVIGRNVKIGIGSVIMAGAIANSDAKIGEFCIINTKASLGHDGHLKEYSSLAPNVTIGGNVKIGTCTAICMSGNVIQDITIGKHSIIGSGALVIRDVPDYSMIYGIPGKFIRKIDKGEKYLYHNKKSEKKESTTDASLEIISNKKKWREILLEIGKYDFYHTYDYHKFSKIEGENPLLIVFRQNNVLIALPLLVRNIQNTKYKDATSTYGYVGPIFKGIDDSFHNSTFTNMLQDYFNKNDIIAVFSRLNPYIPNQSNTIVGFGNIVSQGKIVNIDLSLEIDVQRSKYRSRLKTHVNKSRRLCSVRKAESDEDLQAYIDIYHENMDRVHAKKSYYFSNNYFKNLIGSKDFKTTILLAIDNETDEIIAGSMFIVTNNIVQYHLSGTKNNSLHLTPTKLLIDEMRIIASNEDCKFFNLGGGLGGSDDDSLFDFKSSFSKDFKTFNLWKLVVNKEVYNDLVSKKGISLNSEFFPLYRSIDDLKVNL